MRSISLMGIGVVSAQNLYSQWFTDLRGERRVRFPSNTLIETVYSRMFVEGHPLHTFSSEMAVALTTVLDPPVLF